LSAQKLAHDFAAQNVGLTSEEPGGMNQAGEGLAQAHIAHALVGFGSEGSEEVPLPVQLLQVARPGGVNALADRLASTEALSGQMGQLAERLTTSDATARQTADQVSLIEQRVQAVATELTNQISELGRDIDGLAERSLEGPVSGVSDELLEALRTSQVKLANEQARYEIAFRHDLATLAEQLRHGEQR
ncbi:MAG: hypothetical protein WCI22_09810, partial [Actinomycetota bacterium]